MDNARSREDLSHSIQQVIAATTNHFFELAKLAHLNPTEDFAGSNLSQTDLRGINFRGADLRYANLSYANLKNADFSHANLTGACLTGACLTGANLHQALWENGCLEGTIYKLDSTTACALTLFLVPVAAGFPSPAEDYVEGELDLNCYLIPSPASSYFVRASGDSMVQAGIFSGDLLLVDQSLTPQDGNIVIAVVNGELTVKRLSHGGDRLLLVAENDSYEPLEINEHTDFLIWGVVTYVIHGLR
jgi:DNA polymerase V